MKIFKRCILLLLVLVTAEGFTQTNWVRQPTLFTENLREIYFADSLYGWIAGDSGVIVHTPDGGNNWITQSRVVNDYILDLFFLNRNTGWATAWNFDGISQYSVIYNTTNSGLNWTRTLYPDTVLLINTIYFLNEQKGFIGCVNNGSGVIYYTNDRGLNWQKANTDSNFVSTFPVRTIKFKNANTGFAAGGYFDVSGVVWQTTDGGLNWTSQTVGGEPFNCINYPAENVILISGGDYEFGVSSAISYDNGTTFEYHTNGFFGIGYSTSFRTPSEGWVATGYSQNLLITTDTGKSYTLIPSPDSSSLYGITFPNSNTGWAVGNDGVIYKFSSSTIGMKNLLKNIPNDYLIVGNNYPNPFNPSTTLDFNIREKAKITLRVFDISGKEVLKIEKGELQAGSYYQNINMAGFGTGIYFVKVEAVNREENFFEVRKIVMVK
ncbi:MAG: T9SS type A sorting domain-containing protein [Ignavibacteria bacterium]|nr:T9SS type A sorting domain-containing protein [Ignavibacteria bacterium]